MPTASLPTLTATSAFYYVVSNAGPVPRDQVDSQVVSNVNSLGTSGGFWTDQHNTGFGNSGYGVIVGGQALPTPMAQACRTIGNPPRASA